MNLRENGINNRKLNDLKQARCHCHKNPGDVPKNQTKKNSNAQKRTSILAKTKRTEEWCTAGTGSGWAVHIEQTAVKYNNKSKRYHEGMPKHRKQLVEACLISQLRYGLELYSQGTVQDIKRMEGMVSRGPRTVLQKGKRQWSKTEGLKELGWMTLIEMAAATSMKTMLKVLHNTSSQNLYTALVHEKTQGSDEIKRLTEQELSRMTKRPGNKE